MPNTYSQNQEEKRRRIQERAKQTGNLFTAAEEIAGENNTAQKRQKIQRIAKETGNLFTAAEQVAWEDSAVEEAAARQSALKRLAKNATQSSGQNLASAVRNSTRNNLNQLTANRKTVTPKEIYEGLKNQPDYQKIAKADYTNPATKVRNGAKGLLSPKDAFGYGKHMYQYMTDRELDNYNYLYGKYGIDRAEEYADYLDNELNTRHALSLQYKKDKTFQDHKVVETVLDSTASFLGGAERSVRGLTTGLANAITGKDEPDEYSTEEIYSDLIKQDAAGARRVAYDIADSLGYMAPSVALGALGGGSAVASGAFAASAGGDAYTSAIREGKDVDDARKYAFVNAGSEFATNAILGGIGSLGGGMLKKVVGNSKAGKALADTIKSGVKNPTVQKYLSKGLGYLADMGSEGAQEYTQELLDKLARNVIFDENNEIRLDDEEALYSAALGALTAGVMNLPRAGAEISYDRQIEKLGKDSNIDSYQEFAEGIESDQKAFDTEEDYQAAQELKKLAQNLAEKEQSGQEITNYEKGEFENALNRYASMAVQNASYEGGKAAEDIRTEEISNPVEKAAETADIDADGPVMTEVPPGNQQTQPNEVRAWSEQFGKNGREAFESAYDGEAEMAGYFRGFASYYNAGRYNMEMSEANKSAASVLLSPEQAAAAYRAGALDRNAAEVKYNRDTGLFDGMVQGEEKTGGLAYAAESATEAQKNVASVIGKRTGLSFELVDELDQNGAVAEYRDGTIRISTSTKDFNASVSHELTHFIQDYSPDMYQIYQDQAIQAISRADGIDTEQLFESYIERYRAAGQELTREQAADEIVADATERFFNDPAYIDSVVEKNRTLGEKILDFIEDVIELIKSGPSRRKAAQALESDLEALETARTYWMQGLQEAGDRYRSGAKKTDIREDMQDGTQQEDAQKGKFKLQQPEKVTSDEIEKNYAIVRDMDSVEELKGDEFAQDGTPLSKRVKEYYDQIGNVVHNEVVGDVILNGRSIKDDLAHGMGRLKALTFKAVPSVIEKGKVLRYEKNWKERGYDSAVIGAKIHIQEGEYAGNYYELCVIKVNEQTNRLYLHEVHTIKMDGEPFKTGTSQETGAPGGNPSIFSIFDKLAGVNIEADTAQKTETDRGLRYQLEDIEDHQEDMRALAKENEELREANALLKKQFELTSKDELRQEDIKKVSRKILRDYHSGLKEETLSRNLTRLYEYIRSADHVDGKELSEVAADIARSVLNQSSQKDTALTETYKDLRKQIRNTKIAITEQDRQDLAAMGGYDAFRKKYFGSMKLGQDGISVDSFYQELSSAHPELFSAEITHPADQLMQIGNVLDLTKPQVQNPYHANLDEMSYIVGQELLEAYYDVRQPAPTFADKKAAELAQAREDYKKQLRQFKKKTAAQYNEMLSKKNQEYRDLKDTHMKELLVQREKFNAKMQQRRESLRRQEAKKGIMRERNKLQKWILTPTDKQHIPEELRGTVARFLSGIDFSSKEDDSGIMTQRTRDWLEAQAAFRSIIDAEGRLVDDDGNVHYVDIDPDMAARIQELEKRTRDMKKMEELDAYTLEELQKTVTAMRKALTEINDMKSNARYREASLIAEDVFRDADNVASKKEYRNLLGLGDKLGNVDMLDPQTMFRKMGPAMETTYKALRKGLDTKTIRLREAADYFEAAREESGISKKEIRRWTGVSAPTQVFEITQYQEAEPGKEAPKRKIELTIPQIMSLYELEKRGQARGHIYGHGIKADDLRVGVSWDNRSFKPSAIKKAYKPIKVRPEDVKMITDTLTPEQKQLADALQRFMGNQISEWGNEVSMDMYGYKKFTARDYFPIVTDKNYIMRQEGQQQNSAIKNMGITKNTVRNANNPIIIEDIFEVFTRQVDQMSSYNAYVEPLSDLHKVLNYKDMRGFNGSTIREELERAYGKEGVKYIDKLIEDINGQGKTDKDIFSYFLSNMKTSAVAGNLRVAIQQPTAIARAAAEISPKYLLQGAAKIGTRWETVTKYAPIAQWKDWGFYQMQTSRQMKDIIVGSDSAKQRVVNKTMILAEMGDQVAWKRLWNAVECEISDKRPELSQGSEEYYQAVGERFSEIVDKTQVADSVLHRTQIMRNKNGLVKMGTAFLGEPLKSYNMLYRAYIDIAMDVPGAKKKMLRTTSAYAASTFLTAVAASVVDTLRDDDREKTWWEKYKQNVWEGFIENVNLLNSIPFVKDAISVLKGFIIKRTDMQGITDISNAYKKIEKFMEGDSGYTPQYIFIETVKSLSTVTGIPIKNIVRDSMAIIDASCNAAGGETDYEWLKQTYSIKSEDNTKMYVEMMMEAEDMGNASLAEKIKGDLLETGVTEEDIQSKINTIVNGVIKEGVDIVGTAMAYDSQNADSKKAFQEAVDRYITLKARAGWDEEKCLQQVRAKLTEIYKPQYLAAKTQKEKDAIISKCKSYFYNGDSIYKDYEFAKNWKEKE